MPYTHRFSTVAEAAWADWPESVADAAKATVFHVSRGEPVEVLNVLDEMLADLDRRRRLLADPANAAD